MRSNENSVYSFFKNFAREVARSNLASSAKNESKMTDSDINFSSSADSDSYTSSGSSSSGGDSIASVISSIF